MKHLFRIQTHTIALQDAGLLHYAPEAHYEQDLRRGETVCCNEDRKAIMLHELQSEGRAQTFWNWMIEDKQWRWKFLRTTRNEIVVLLTRRSRWIPTGEWLCKCSH